MKLTQDFSVTICGFIAVRKLLVLLERGQQVKKLVGRLVGLVGHFVCSSLN
jgi:hypothetical protein